MDSAKPVMNGVGWMALECGGKWGDSDNISY